MIGLMLEYYRSEAADRIPDRFKRIGVDITDYHSL